MENKEKEDVFEQEFKYNPAKDRVSFAVSPASREGDDKKTTSLYLIMRVLAGKEDVNEATNEIILYELKDQKTDKNLAVNDERAMMLARRLHLLSKHINEVIVSNEEFTEEEKLNYVSTWFSEVQKEIIERNQDIKAYSTNDGKKFEREISSGEILSLADVPKINLDKDAPTTSNEYNRLPRSINVRKELLRNPAKGYDIQKYSELQKTTKFIDTLASEVKNISDIEYANPKYTSYKYLENEKSQPEDFTK